MGEKIDLELAKITCTQATMARALGVTPAYISKLIKNGTVVRDLDDRSGGVFVFQSLKNYFKKGKDSDEADYYSERAKHERVKRQIMELRLAKEEGKLYEAAVVENVIIEQLAGLRTHLLGLGVKLAPILEGKHKGAIAEIINREVEEKLSELSTYKPELFLVEAE